MPQSTPDNALVIRTYEVLDRFTRAFAEGSLNLLIVIGPPGVQKSRCLKAALGSSACWIDGNATAFGLYCELYRSRDEPIVIDDVDSLYADRAGVRLLKCLCQTEARKRVGWHSNAATLCREGIPRAFETESRVTIIANEWRTLNVNVSAIQDRGHVIVFAPSALEVHTRTAQWFWDQDVYDFIGQHLHLTESPSMRDYWLSWELKRAGLDWRGCLLERWGISGRRLLVAQLKADPSYATEEDRVRAFIEKGGGCRATYFNHAQKLRPQFEVRQIVLKNNPPDKSRSEWMELLRLQHGRLGNG